MLRMQGFYLLIVKILLLIIALTVVVAYMTYAERKVVAFMQSRLGPNRVGWRGLAQPLADVVKLLFKEICIPEHSSRVLFILAPVLVIVPALIVWSIIPFSLHLVVADINVGLLFIFVMLSLSACGILVAGWASNSKYALFGALREAAQMISYELVMGFAVVAVALAASSMNLTKIVMSQAGGVWHWFWLPLAPILLAFFVAGIAQTNRLPLDFAEAESELVAGFHVEYSGAMFALFFLAEYANMLLISALTVLLFFGGWLSPFQGVAGLEQLFNWVPGIVWLLAKMVFFMFGFFWLRAALPRLRYDQSMRLGWKILLPATLVWVVLEAMAILFKIPPWFAT